MSIQLDTKIEQQSQKLLKVLSHLSDIDINKNQDNEHDSNTETEPLSFVMYEVYDHRTNKSQKYGYYDTSVVFADSIQEYESDGNSAITIEDFIAIDALCE